MAGDIKLKYTASSSLTVTVLNSLASAAGFLAGAEVFAYDDSTALDEDVLLAGQITTAAAAGLVEVYVVGTQADAVWPDTFTGSSAARTVGSLVTKALVCRPVAVFLPLNGLNYFGPVSVASLFGGTLPLKFSVFVTQSTGAALAASGHALYVTPVKRQYT